jgi:hypothetical protein
MLPRHRRPTHHGLGQVDSFCNISPPCEWAGANNPAICCRGFCKDFSKKAQRACAGPKFLRHDMHLIFDVDCSQLAVVPAPNVRVPRPGVGPSSVASPFQRREPAWLAPRRRTLHAATQPESRCAVGRSDERHAAQRQCCARANRRGVDYGKRDPQPRYAKRLDMLRQTRLVLHVSTSPHPE